MLIDTTKEIEEMQNELWMKRATRERAEFMFGMVASARQIIIASLSKDLSKKEFKKQLFERTYGEPLPADFFKDEE
ncbi:MAG TPA: hypothetical protein VNI60_01660 [Pyrinomonadaceae bacterium]|nr:hypothetical protein [Pyrinomonadaceae bacterium]